MSNFIVDSFVYTFTSDEPSAKRGRTGIGFASSVFIFMGILCKVEQHALGTLGALILASIGLTLYAVIYAVTCQIDTIAGLKERR